eukprot:CAMPEP_0202726192 /NCGR_PEP_ID=MMETSP1385-20130828/184485_1 /ASSEMBLY_ACC=CAM_ASM_000861 /TAXON_ID=933848 /ORGANISM="Elphidium margaritaceum" /LENGTH=760 /DNA_ID=CAMNT_0049392407 /DNA_START=105 /DNA_END=2383 /DNA_ORIENTATION=+
MAILLVLSFSAVIASLARAQSYIYVGDQPKAWQDAEAYCSSTYGTSLASWSTDAEAEEIQALSPTVVWVGLNDLQQDGVWQFSDGSVDCLAMSTNGCAQVFNYWNSVEPNGDSGTNFDCAAHVPRTQRLVWQFSDGSVDCLAMSTNGCAQVFNYWNSVEPNGDSGTNFDCAHTYPGHSVYDMLNDRPCSDVYTFVCNAPYVIIETPYSWVDAEAACQDTYGTSLASLQSLADQAFVEGLCASPADGTLCWLGGVHTGSGDSCAYSYNDGTEFPSTTYNDVLNFYSAGEFCSTQPYMCILPAGNSAAGLHECIGATHELFYPICNAPTTGTTIDATTLAPRDPELQCVSSSEYAANGNIGGYYSFAGQACHVWGDPHFENMFNGQRHQFQGRANRQYQYMKACADAPVAAMPFELLAKHYQVVPNGVQTIDYVSLKLFDGAAYNAPYLVHIHSTSFFCVYPQSSSTQTSIYDKQFYDLNTGICSPIAASTATPIGTSDRFSILYTRSGNRVDVTLTVDGVCTLQFYFSAAGRSIGGRYRENTLHIYPPQCFRCFTCGLCGSFKEYDGNTMPTCNGGLVTVQNNYGSFAYDENGNTYDAEYCADTGARRRRLVGDSLGELYVPDLGDFVPVDGCDDLYRQTAVDACAAARSQVDDCCNALGDAGETCDAYEEACVTDGCIDASLAADASEIDTRVSIFTDMVDTLCAENDPLTPMLDPATLVVDETAEDAIVETQGDPFASLCVSGVATFDWDEMMTTSGAA